MKLRVVFDTSSLIGAILRPNSISHRALNAAVNSLTLCLSPELLKEFKEVVARPHFEKYATAQARNDFVNYFCRNAEMFIVNASETAAVSPRCRDTNDNHILALAEAAEAAIIVSSDHDLLTLSPWNGIPILTPAEFLAQVENLEY
jgi:uncharacterized protein